MIDVSNLRRAVSMLDVDLRWRWLGLFGLSIIAALLEAVGALGVFGLIAVVNNPDYLASLPVVGPLSVKLGFTDSMSTVIALSLAVIVFYVIKDSFLAFHYYLQLKLPHDAYVRVSTNLLRGYLTTSYSFHFDRNSAEVVRNMITSVDIVFRTVLVNALMLVSEALLVIAVLCVLVVASPVETLLAAGVLSIIAFALLRLSQGRVTRIGVHVQAHAKDLLKVINQGLGAIKEVKVLNREGYFLTQYHQLRERQSRLMCLYETIQNIPKLSLEAIFTVLLGGLIILVTLEGRDRASVIPLLGLFGYVGFRLFPSLAGISAKLQRLAYGAAAVKQVYDDYTRLNAAPEPLSEEAAPLRFAQDVRFESVSYSYPRSDRPALNRVSVTVPHGFSIGVVGPSGGGKSTLVDILLGLLSPDSGRVLVDGVDIGTAVRAWQRNLGYVPQSPYLLDETLRRNIAFGVRDDDVDDVAVMDAVRMAQLSELVDSLPNGLDTEIGERGIRLSGGQRQRIVIARALYRRPAVLVFDEATSALDNQTEREITAAIEALSGHRTVIIVAHRMTTVRRCNFIVFLVEGQIADTGTYDELLARNPDFRRLALTEKSVPVEESGNMSHLGPPDSRRGIEDLAQHHKA